MLIKFIVIRIQPTWFRFTDFCRLVGSYEIQSEIDGPGSSVKPVWKTMAIKSCLTIFIKWKKSFKNLISNSPRSKLKLFHTSSSVEYSLKSTIELTQSNSNSLLYHSLTLSTKKKWSPRCTNTIYSNAWCKCANKQLIFIVNERKKKF